MANLIGPRVSMKSSVRLGRETIQFMIGKEMELFTVHKELICSSKYFRNMLQPRRKAIEDEGECTICHDAFDPGVKELTYCASSCGSNFHRSCMDDWRRNGPLSNAVLEAMLQACVVGKYLPSVRTVVKAYEITRAASPLRKFLVCLHMELNDQEYSGVLASWNEYPARFQKDLARAMMRERGKGVGTRGFEALKQKLLTDDWGMEE
ncbi:hypothetical protein B5807_08358 [Epicoccum nigrum]|uniref:RING-type domain-containing protein n=1 Tax=Epicoccum nigrum TaxID=105696 RepID=A0A1Y2LRW3_EPING|nr:hypothetical protein B5807_08358 [Epicoccum nigrum]